MQQATKGDFAEFDASDWRIGIVVAQFNKHITDQQLESALKHAKDYGILEKNITVIKVAGAMEIPLALQYLAKTGKMNALLALGCVVKGDTPHFDYVCKSVAEGILRVQLDTNTPVGFGVLTCNTEAQALSRTDLAGEHLDAALHLARSIS